MRALTAVMMAVVLFLPVTVQMARAETAVADRAAVADLSRALRMAEAMVLLREEGIANGKDLAADLPGGPQDELWSSALDRIYDPARMEALFNEGLAKALSDNPQAITAATTFFTADLGHRALGLELAAREAMMDEVVEATAAEAYAALATKDPARQALIDRFVEANDLVESNVMGALNANLAFLRGMAEAGGAAFAMPEADMLAQVWGAEPDTRAEMVGWLFPFLTLAYQPLSDDELEAYVAFSETPEGHQLNAAMFQAFDVVFEKISRDLGRAFAQSLQGDNI
jgi:hypothetical protein